MLVIMITLPSSFWIPGKEQPLRVVMLPLLTERCFSVFPFPLFRLSQVILFQVVNFHIHSLLNPLSKHLTRDQW